MRCGSTRWASVGVLDALDLQAAIFATFALITFCVYGVFSALYPIW